MKTEEYKKHKEEIDSLLRCIKKRYSMKLYPEEIIRSIKELYDGVLSSDTIELYLKMLDEFHAKYEA